MKGIRGRKARNVVAGLALGGALIAPAAAQSTEFKLGEARDWSTVKEPEAGSDAAIVAQARRHLAEDNPAAAQSLLDPWIETNRRPGSPHFPDALLVRGDALVAQDKELKALYDYEEVCKNHRESDAFTTAVERELDIAVRYANGLRLRIFGIRWGDPEEILVELMLRVSERLPRSQAAERAMIELADYYYRQRELAQAKDVYDAYLESFPNGPNSLHARERRINCDVGRFKGPRYNAAALIDAKVQIEQFERRYPAEADAAGLNAALASRLDESMAAQLLDTAKWYLKNGDEASSRFVLKRLLRDHPLTLSAERGAALLREKGWEEPQPAPSEPAADGQPDPSQDLDRNAAPATEAPAEPTP